MEPVADGDIGGILVPREFRLFHKAVINPEQYKRTRLVGSRLRTTTVAKAIAWLLYAAGAVLIYLGATPDSWFLSSGKSWERVALGLTLLTLGGFEFHYGVGSKQVLSIEAELERVLNRRFGIRALEAFDLSVPEGWSFALTVGGIARHDSKKVEFIEFTPAELATPMKGQLHAPTVIAALGKLRSLTVRPDAIRPYDVQLRRDTYSLRIRENHGKQEHM